MNARFKALLRIDDKSRCQLVKQTVPIPSEIFGQRTFNRSIMQKMLPHDVYENIIRAMEGQEKIRPEYADIIAVAMKEWAISHGATHYSHWFQPLTGTSAEKHDAFLDWNINGKVIEKFSGKQLLQGEPDASSFPSGGLRSTYEARGYTGWDPASPVFLWQAGDGITLCIPSVFFSWTGAVLDSKIPLLRSDRKINKAASRLLKLTGLSARYVYSTLGFEQEYFVVDRSLRNLRPDLVLLGKTVFGAPSPKGQELQDHYFGSVKDRILSFMQDFETAAIQLGIPVKTRHNEVAPAQHEVAPVYEKASAAVDHNLLIMELLRQYAQKHHLACLLHEKPFAGLNGSGKHCNWSLATDTGINLLDPTDAPQNNLHFLILLTSILHAVYQHAPLLRASIGSASNDSRLGGHEAPPAILSVYLGEALEDLLTTIEEKGAYAKQVGKRFYNLGLIVIPKLPRDNTDRNRTCPFAFTGNKFEFRAVGSSANPSFPATVLNLIVAESLNQILDEIEEQLDGQTVSQEELVQICIPILQKYLKKSKSIRFTGDNYSEEWIKEARRRRLSNIKRSPEAFENLTSEQTIKVFKQVLTKEELKSRQEINLEIYSYNRQIEANLMIDLFKTQILPASLHYQERLASSLDETSEVLGKKVKSSLRSQYLKELTETIEQGLQMTFELEKLCQDVQQFPVSKQAKKFSEEITDKMEGLRKIGDKLETIVDDQLWPLPKYRELLFLI